jgi:hypothetical protein
VSLCQAGRASRKGPPQQVQQQGDRSVLRQLLGFSSVPPCTAKCCRYCEYQISRKGGAAPSPAELLGQIGGGASDQLHSKLASLAAAAQAQAAAATSSLEWAGEVHPVRDEKIRIPLHAAQAGRGGSFFFIFFQWGDVHQLAPVPCLKSRGLACTVRQAWARHLPAAPAPGSRGLSSLSSRP